MAYKRRYKSKKKKRVKRKKYLLVPRGGYRFQ